MASRKKSPKPAMGGVLVGTMDGSRLYYLVSKPDGQEFDGLLVEPSGRSRMIHFAKSVGMSRNVKKFSTSDFHRFLWGVHEGEKLNLWRSIFISKTKNVPNEMLKDVPVREEFTPADKKRKTIEKKTADFIAANSESSLSSRTTWPFEVKGLGRTISRGIAGASFDPNAYDADNDGFIQDATPWMRPALTVPLTGMRSATAPTRPVDGPQNLDGIPDTLLDLLKPEELRRIIDLTEEAQNTGMLQKHMRVTVSDYKGLTGSAFVQIVDINPKTGKQSKISVFGTPELMEVEDYAHRVGQEILKLITSRAGIDDAIEERNRRIEELSKKFTLVQSVEFAALTKMGVTPQRELQYGRLAPRIKHDRNNPPADPELAKIHARIASELQKSDDDGEKISIDIQYAKQNKTASSLAGNSRSEKRFAEMLAKAEAEQIVWRQKRDALYDEYAKAVTDTHQRLSREIGGDEYDGIIAEAEQLVETLESSGRPKLTILDEFLQVMQQFGVTFGNETLKLRLPKRDDTEVNRPFLEQAKELADHTQRVAGRYLPDSLIRAINDFSGRKGLRVTKINPRTGAHGMWNEANKNLQTDGSDSTTLHELTHALADSNTFLHILQQLVLGARWVGRKDEKSRKRPTQRMLDKGWDNPKVVRGVAGSDTINMVEDEFTDLYAGRIYGLGGAAETLTRAFDYLTDPSFDGEASPLDSDLIASLFGGLLIAALGESSAWMGASQ